jgi:uncharacterized membrane protein YtjA (UPF0391 family)
MPAEQYPGSGVLRHAVRRGRLTKQEGEHIMLYWALLFLVIALIAGLLGFGGVASAATGIAKILFFVFIVIFVITLVSHMAAA